MPNAHPWIVNTSGSVSYSLHLVWNSASSLPSGENLNQKSELISGRKSLILATWRLDTSHLPPCSAGCCGVPSPQAGSAPAPFHWTSRHNAMCSFCQVLQIYRHFVDFWTFPNENLCCHCGQITISKGYKRESLMRLCKDFTIYPASSFCKR